MAFSLGDKSRAELKGVHPKLIAVVQRAIVLSAQDFSVHDGVRTLDQQKALVRSGASKTMNSRHLIRSDGFGHAVDLVPYINGKLRWEWEPIYRIALAVRQAAVELGVDLVWGGVWDRKVSELPATVDGIRAAVAAYCARHPGPDFIDGPHFEMAQK